jgi:EmrB/QacA subfamily drug resistance transporter
MSRSTATHAPGWTYAIAAVAAFMVNLDNLVVTTALPSIRLHLHSGVQGLEWVVNAYTLTFAVLLLTGAALGDRFGRRRMFGLGLGLFTLASMGAALAPNIDALIAFRAIQGVGGAIVLPLTLTLLSHAASPERRPAVLGLFGAVAGLAVAVGPLVGGAITEAGSWHWIFWLNVPIGLAVLPLIGRVQESYGPSARLDLVGVLLGSSALFGVVYALVRTDTYSWGSAEVMIPLLAGLALLAAFVGYERRTTDPMLPLRLFRSRSFSAANGASLLFSFGMFGSIFLLAQFLQTVQHFSPLGAGLRTLPWTAMPMAVAPIAAPLSARWGARPFLVSGLAMQAAGLAWLAELLRPAVPFSELVVPFVLCGVGMSLFFVPVANVVLSSVRAEEEGVASGTNNAFRELGGVLGIAVLASIFASHGSYVSGHAFVSGARPAVEVGAIVVAVGAVIASLIGRRLPRLGGSTVLDLSETTPTEAGELASAG